MKKRKEKGKGFTLVEIVTVAAIVAILAAYATPKLFGIVEDAERTQVTMEVKNLEAELNHFLLQNKVMPSLAAMEENKLYFDSTTMLNIPTWPSDFPAQFPCTQEFADATLNAWTTMLVDNYQSDLATFIAQGRPQALIDDTQYWLDFFSNSSGFQASASTDAGPGYEGLCVVRHYYNHWFEWGYFEEVQSVAGAAKKYQIARDNSGICLTEKGIKKKLKVITLKVDGSPTTAKEDVIGEVGEVVEDNVNC